MLGLCCVACLHATHVYAGVSECVKYWGVQGKKCAPSVFSLQFFCQKVDTLKMCAVKSDNNALHMKHHIIYQNSRVSSPFFQYISFSNNWGLGQPRGAKPVFYVPMQIIGAAICHPCRPCVDENPGVRNQLNTNDTDMEKVLLSHQVYKSASETDYNLYLPTHRPCRDITCEPSLFPLVCVLCLDYK